MVMAVRELIKKGEKEIRERKTRVIPAVDIVESQNEYTLYADMPGVDEKSLDVTLEKDILSIKAESHVDIPEGYRKFYHEIEPVVYERTFRIVDDIDRDKVMATFKNGVLQLTLPKAETAKPRKIEITT
ncbi:MAG: Hsp20/alpha crystallin family protein [Nitrospirae bacterium]|nr:MAG: Hsp20/alpha crystallin family protein [Nitrospirota bacterium]